MPRTRTAATIVKDSQGHVTATIVAIQDSVSEYNRDQFKWTFSTTTNQGRAATMTIWTGTNINQRKTYFNEATETWSYNKLTTILLNLKVISEEQLLAGDYPEIDLDEELQDATVKFKTKPAKKRVSLEEIDISSMIRLVD